MPTMSSQASPEMKPYASIGVERERGTRAVDFLPYVYFAIKKYWIGPRPTMKVADTDVGHMLEYGWAEGVEMLGELEGSTLNLNAYAREAVDELVILSSASMNNGIVPDFKAIATSANGQANNETKLLGTLEKFTRVESVDGIDNPVALKAHLNKLYTAVFSFIHHGPVLPSPDFILYSLEEVLSKNSRNYPAEYFQNTHWQTGRKLTDEEMEASYYHASRSLRIIRTFTGNKPEGLDRQDHYPYRFFIWDFENSQARQNELRQVLQQDLVTPTVFPEGMSQTVLTYQPSSMPKRGVDA
jgi:hypothetical protein